MSRYSSLDYLLKKATLVIQETLTESSTDKTLKDSTATSLITGSQNPNATITIHNKYLPFIRGTVRFSVEVEKNQSIFTSKWTNFINLSTSTPTPYLVTEETYTSESDVQFANETYPIADHLFENWWNIFDERYLKHGWGWTITLIIAYMSILVAGVIGNVMVILVVFLRPQMRTVTNMFIANLAVADLFVIVFCVPSTLLANIFSPWILGSFMCKAVAYVQGVSGCASAYSLAAISFDRCQAVYRNYERPRGFSQRICVRTVFVIWITAMLLTIPWAVIFEVKVSEYDGLRYCVETWDEEKHGNIYFLVVNLLCFYAIPLLLIFVSNWIIYCHVTHRHVPDDSISSAPLRKMHRDTKQHVLKMLGIVTLTFLFCWLPIYILVIIIKFSDNISETAYYVLGILMPIAQWLGSCNSGVNPILYAFLNKRFREMCKSILPSWCPIKPTRKYVVSRGRSCLATAANADKKLCRSGERFLHNEKNLLISRYNEHSNTVSTNTAHTLLKPKSGPFTFVKDCQRNMAVIEMVTVEITTAL